MSGNLLKQLGNLGQAVWLDYIRRDLIAGKLRQLIEEDGVCGITSNPAIFEKAIAGGQDYDADIGALAAQGRSSMEIYDTLSLLDVRHAADVLRTVYAATSGQDGYVSLELNPHLARDTDGSIEEARRLWRELDRPNVCIKAPATAEGLPVIRQLISEGINVNVTLIFGLSRYRQAAEAYIAGIEDRCAQDKPLRHVVSFASFFLSRIDALIDPLLDKIIRSGGDQAVTAENLRGQLAVASAKLAYQMHKELFEGERFQKLAACCARVQRLLWASTGVKDPQYSDVKYVDSVAAPNTVNTMPPETLDAYRDHGNPQIRIEEDVAAATERFKLLAGLGINLEQITQQLEAEGIEKFNKPFDRLLQAIAAKAVEQQPAPPSVAGAAR